jgi:hypothetical protein
MWVLAFELEQHVVHVVAGRGNRERRAGRVGWLTLAALGIVWAAFLLPRGRRSGSLVESVEDFERKMELLAETGRHEDGRWIITPRKGTAFLGPDARAEARARERRRRVFVSIVESIGLTFLIGLVPPLRPMWAVTGILVAALGAYVWLLLWMKEQGAEGSARRRVQDASVPDHPKPVRERHVSHGTSAKPAYNGLGVFDHDDLTNIVVRPVRKVGMAGA